MGEEITANFMFMPGKVSKTKSAFLMYFDVTSNLFDNFFCCRLLVITDRWESGILDGENQCQSRPTQNPFPTAPPILT